ncbi:lytic transglycosylase domain-containing protein [Pseudoxanthomonas koreensis]|uniref:lytic transglycosylase domain-containing protein n=1 Tax=Pseudoxanthomonas koreensis TaxID=266061 RepID=UPI0035A69786
MLAGLEMLACPELAVPKEIMQHVVRVESSFNPYAIGVVDARLVRQPRNLGEAVSTARMLEQQGYNFSLGLAQVNRYNLAKQGLDSYEKAFEVCPNLQAGSRILAECHGRAGGDWGKALSCYYSGNFTRGFRDGYVQKVFASWQGGAQVAVAQAGADGVVTRDPVWPMSLVQRRVFEAGGGARRAAAPAARPSRVAPVLASRQPAAPAPWPDTMAHAPHAPHAPAVAAPPAAARGGVDDGPVTVQLMGQRPPAAAAPAVAAPTPLAPPGSGAGQAVPHAGASPLVQDSAFVF